MGRKYEDGEREELEKIQKKKVKWTLNFDSCTPDHILYKETGLDRIRVISKKGK